MLEFLGLLVGLVDLAGFVLAAWRYWRISAGVLAAATGCALICSLAPSPAIRWIVGFPVVAILGTAGIVWEQTRGRLGDPD